MQAEDFKNIYKRVMTLEKVSEDDFCKISQLCKDEGEKVVRSIIARLSIKL